MYGIQSTAWKPEEVMSADLLVVGRDALKQNQGLPVEVEQFVAEGGNLLVMVQDPEWLREYYGLRVSRFMSRRVFPISASQGAVPGVESEDLRDWAGHSTLLDPYPDWRNKSSDTWGPNYPYIGGRWGGRGAVSSAAIETPHFGGWTPWLVAEFDLAYSPLLEKRFGQGRIILCMLDLEDHASLDPSAYNIGAKLFEYASGDSLLPVTRETVAIGLGRWTSFLEQSAIAFEEATQLPQGAAGVLAILGPDARVTDAQMSQFLQRGGNVLIFARDSEADPLGLHRAKSNDFAGSLEVPDWQQAQGLGVSDLRYRTELPTWLFQKSEGWAIGADGLLARKQVGSGVAIAAQFDPERFKADEKTYFRFTRWRQTRALNQILSNLGATHRSDSALFKVLSLDKKPSSMRFYHPDYRSDFLLGDDPFRFYKW
jgi:beta-galactosidase